MSMQAFFNRPGTESYIKNLLLHVIRHVKDSTLGAVDDISDIDLILVKVRTMQ